MRKFLHLLLALFMLSGCASKASNISAAYVSPVQYNSCDCDQIGQEMQRVNRKVMEISGAQDSAATKDAVALGVGLVLFWPALFFMAGGDKKDELARLKGEAEALDQVAISKKCDLEGTRVAILKEREKYAKENEVKNDDDFTAKNLNHSE